MVYLSQCLHTKQTTYHILLLIRFVPSAILNLLFPIEIGLFYYKHNGVGVVYGAGTEKIAYAYI